VEGILSKELCKGSDSTVGIFWCRKAWWFSRCFYYGITCSY